MGRTFNQRQVANQLQTIMNPDAEEARVLTALASLPRRQALKALDQMSAQQYTTIIPSAELVNQHFQRDLYESIRDLATSCIDCNCYFGNCQQWIDGSYEKTNVHGSRNARGFRSEEL